MPGGDDVASGRMERCGAIQEAWNVAGHCNASQDAQDAWDAENTSLASGRNADGSHAGSVFADVGYQTHYPFLINRGPEPEERAHFQPAGGDSVYKAKLSHNNQNLVY